VKIYAAAIAALVSGQFEFRSLVLTASGKSDAKKKSMQLCENYYPKELGYSHHAVSVTEVKLTLAQ